MKRLLLLESEDFLLYNETTFPKDYQLQTFCILEKKSGEFEYATLCEEEFLADILPNNPKTHKTNRDLFFYFHKWRDSFLETISATPPDEIPF